MTDRPNQLHKTASGTNMSLPAKDRNEQTLILVIRVSSSLSLGVMAAFLVSIRQVTPELRLGLSFWTVAAFGLALAFSWLFWRLVFQPDGAPGPAPESTRRLRRRAVLFAVLSAVLCLATLAAFGLSLKGIGNERVREIIQGAAIAVLTLAFLGFVLWRLARFFDKDSHRGSGTGEAPPELK